MKHLATLTCLLLSFIAPPAFAIPSNDCAAKSAKVKPEEQDDFMKSCLAQAASPSNVKEAKQKHKGALCEQNAKNKKLQGGDKANYQANCMNKNEAAVVASAQPQNSSEPAHKSTSTDSSKSAPHKAASKKSVAKKEKAPKKAKEHKKSTKKVAKPAAQASGSIEGL